ncbi:hypothetical protein [Leptospira ellinghausenii]|nr:hypothetical protein [Leptospira ellinghausenii]
MEKYKINEKDTKFIHNLFPTPTQRWNELIKLFTFHVEKDFGYYYLASVCARDIADTLQSCYHSYFEAIKEYLIEKKSKLNGENYERAAIHKMRYFLDYAIIALITTQNHLSSGYWHLYFKENQPLEFKYKSPKDISKEINVLDSKSSFYNYIITINKKPEFINLNEFRNTWLHRGIPIINGEYRFKRKKLWEENFHEGQIGLYKQKEGMYMVEYTEQSDNTVKNLIRRSSNLYKFTLENINTFIAEMEKEKSKIYQ